MTAGTPHTGNAPYVAYARDELKKVNEEVIA